jgi:hypothetical protein
MEDMPLFASVKVATLPYTLHNGDCLDVLKTLPDASADAVVSDPPAGISFMSANWDSDKGGRTEWVRWMTEVMTECFRVLKPGGHALVWSLPRTSHWTAWALEDAGFEVRDCISHQFGTGFPKSLDLSAAIDKIEGAERTEIIGARHRNVKPFDDKNGWNANNTTGSHNYMAPKSDPAKKYAGFGTNLKPAYEAWWLCRKPVEGTIAANVLKHGTGGLNIDACRVGGEPSPSVERRKSAAPRESIGSTGWVTPARPPEYNVQRAGEALGRWPANLMLSHSPACVHVDADDDTDLWACVPGCPIRALDAQSGPSGGCAPASGPTLGKLGKHGVYGKAKGENMGAVAFHGKVDGASRFFMRFDPNDAPFIYLPKTSTKERKEGLAERNSHPTLKSVALMSYLCRLVTPPGGVVLDPFMGSGTTGVAALREGFRFIGIERESEYFAIAEARLDHAAKTKA